MKVVVTGSASGMGAAVAERLGGAGWDVLGVDRGGDGIRADLSTAEGRASAAAAVEERAEGAIDAVVACAGIGLPSPDPAAIVSVNFFGVRDLLTPLVPLLAAAPAPKAVVVVSNSAAIIPDVPGDLVGVLLDGDEARARELAVEAGDIMAYAASKLAISRWLRRASVSPEWAGAGIRLNGIAPGATRTPMLDRADADPTMLEMSRLMPVPAGREGTSAQIAALAEVLVSPVADLLLGQIIFHDGGTEALVRGEHWPSQWSMGLR